MATPAHRRARRVAERQHAIITYAEALACGLTPRQIELLCRTGEWERVVRGVYRVVGAPQTWRQRAFAAQRSVATAGGVVSHATSLALHGLVQPSLLPHVTVPPGRSNDCRIAKVHRAPLALSDSLTIDGIRTTSPSRAVVDAARWCDRPMLEELVDSVLIEGLASEASIQDAIARLGRRVQGRLTLVSVLEVWTREIEPGSPAEVRLLRRLDEWGLGGAVTQHEVFTPDGVFVARVDVAWPGALVALEYEGRAHHGPRRTAVDEARYAQLRAMGWWLGPVDKHDILPGERRLPDLLLPLLASRVA